MADPITIGAAAITGLVGLYKAYTEYKAAALKAGPTAAPAKTDEATKGEQVAQVLETGIQQHGKPDEQTALAGYQQNPQLFEPVLSKVIADVAGRNPAFAQQLQTLAQQAGVQGSGVQGNINVSGQGKIQGQAAGVNTGTMSGTFSFNDDDDDKGTK
jgi:hypothetical protein